MKQNYPLYLVAALIVVGIVISLVSGWELLSAGQFASGFFAAGDFSIGVFAAGNFAVGIFSAGIFSVGIFSIGIFSTGIFSVGIFVYALKKRTLKY